MANYRSYKKVTSSQIVDGAVDSNNFVNGVRDNWCVKWTYGNPCRCSAGCCCLFTMPANTRNATFELWGAGGNGNGIPNDVIQIAEVVLHNKHVQTNAG